MDAPVAIGGSMYDNYRVSIEVLANGFKVEVPDMAKVKAKKAEAKKAKDMHPYLGDCNKSFAAKTTKEVMKIVEASLKDLPDLEYDAAWDED